MMAPAHVLRRYLLVVLLLPSFLLACARAFAWWSECESWSVDRWRSELHSLFSHLHSTIRQSFITNYAHPSAPPPGNSFTNAKPPAEQRHIDEKGIVRNANGDPIHGGSTATMVVMVKDANGAGANLITANVGDSTAFLVPTRGTWDFLSVDHGPENQDEWVRVNTSQEEAHQFQTKLLFVYDKTNVYRKYECPNVFLPDGTKDQQYVANPSVAHRQRRDDVGGRYQCGGLISLSSCLSGSVGATAFTRRTFGTSRRCTP